MVEPISATVSFKVARKLAEAGYDQTRHFGLWYGETGFALLAEIGRRTPSPAFYFGPRPTWLSKVDTLTAAPAHLQAAAFLASKGYEAILYMKSDRMVGEVFIQVGELLHENDPDSLILAICEHMEAANELREGAAYWQNRALQAEAKSEERRVALENYTHISRKWSVDFEEIVEELKIAHALSDDVVEHTEHRWVVDVKPFSADYWRAVTFATSPHSREVFCAIPGCVITADQEVK